MLHHRRTALFTGALYLLTVGTSIPALALKEPILNNPETLTTLGGQTMIIWAALLEIVLTAACIGTAVTIYPIIRRKSEFASLGFVSARVLESGLISVGVIALLSIITVNNGAMDRTSLSEVNSTLSAVHDAAFLLGPGLIPAANALLLGSILYRAHLVPRIIPLIGFVGAPLLVGSVLATLFGALDQVSPIAGIAALPIAVWEISLGFWLVAKGFRPAAVARLANMEGVSIHHETTALNCTSR